MAEELIESGTGEVVVVTSPEVIGEGSVATEVVEIGVVELISDTSTSVEVLQDGQLEVIHEPSVQYEQIIETRVGPPGPPGPSEDDMTYAKRVDFVSDNLLYRGEAEVGSTNEQEVWRIRRVTIGGDGDVTEEWADGTSDFLFAWDDRTILDYL